MIRIAILNIDENAKNCTGTVPLYCGESRGYRDLSHINITLKKNFAKLPAFSTNTVPN